MNEKAVKKLTQKGCIVEKDAAESLTENDLEAIERLDTPPMVLSEKMLDSLRTTNESSNKTEVEDTQQMEETEEEPEELNYTGEGSEETEKDQGAPESLEDDEENGTDESDESGSGSKFSASKTVTIKDSGRRDRLKTKVEVLDRADVSKEEKDVPEFLANYNDRYKKLKKLLMRRRELQSAVSIKNLERRDEGDQVAFIGMVNRKYSTKSGKYMVSLEDKTGEYRALVDERDGERIVPDEIIGIRGSMGDGIVFANSVIRPDLPIPDGVNTTEQEVKAAYISDLHLGSEDTLYERFDRFAEWLNSEDASKIGYLVIAGDVVEGVGTYPGQEDELEVTDIYKQYNLFEDWVDKLPDDIQVIVGPGNHDIVRLAEPQPAFDGDAFDRIHTYDNVHLVQNPQKVRLHGIESKGILNLMYHGYSFDDHVDQIQDLREKAYDEPYHVMIDLLKRRHLAPTYGSNLMSPEGKDTLVIDEKPDIMVSGHFHSHSAESYKGTNVIASSSFQAQTDFQRRVGHVPDPGKVTVVNYKTRDTRVIQF
ncbi:metallophosphoesterase [Candidatus Nanohalococcus occultus]|uniref:metallophosphoesterase n=1 Tax=Candidatus Nanohalococcus occultus TaxID=2978047 RepID=UPI0039E04841